MSPTSEDIQNTLKKYLQPKQNTSVEFDSEQSSQKEMEMFLDLESKAKGDV